jgi:hypothetical protein
MRSRRWSEHAAARSASSARSAAVQSRGSSSIAHNGPRTSPSVSAIGMPAKPLSALINGRPPATMSAQNDGDNGACRSCCPHTPGKI